MNPPEELKDAVDRMKVALDREMAERGLSIIASTDMPLGLDPMGIEERIRLVHQVRSETFGQASTMAMAMDKGQTGSTFFIDLAEQFDAMEAESARLARGGL